MFRLEVYDSASDLGIGFCAHLVSDGKMLDRVGSRPVLGLAAFIFGIHWLGWGAVAAHLVPFQWGPILFQQTTAGIGLALYNSAHMRL